MRKPLIGPTVAFVTFSIGLIVAAVFTIPLTDVSEEPAVPLYQVSVEIKRPEFHDVVWETQQYMVEAPAEPDPKAVQNSDLSIVIESSEPNPKPPSYRRQYIKLVKHGATVIDLDLAESIDSGEVSLNFRDTNEYRVFQRYRTTMTISMEGPHVDLDDWRHFDSPWTQLKTLSSKRFRTLATNQMDYSRFPPTTNDEIVKEVRRRVGMTWPAALESAKDCQGPNDGACFVSVSSIYFQIQKRVRDGWISVGLVDVRLPMGC